MDVLAVGGFDGPLDGFRDPSDEPEGAALQLLLRAMGNDEERQPPRVLAAPMVGSLVGPTTADDGADPGARLGQPRGVLAGRLAGRLPFVGPPPPEHPVVQPFATLAESLAGAVVWSRDVPVDRRRDSRHNLRHYCPTLFVRGRVFR